MRRLLVSLLFLSASASAPAAAAPELIGLGVASASAVSDGGRVVVGTVGEGESREPYRWVEGSFGLLGPFPRSSRMPGGSAGHVSADGSVVAGEYGPEWAWRWTEAGGFDPLPWEEIGISYLSSDGSVAAGVRDTGLRTAYRWSEDDGFCTIFPTAPPPACGPPGSQGGSDVGAIRGLSGDGATVVGESFSSDNIVLGLAVWRDEALFPLEGIDTVSDVNDDGSILLARAEDGRSVLFDWLTGTIVEVPFLGAASGDLSVIATAESIWFDGQGAFDWADLGLDLGGWSLGSAVGMSPDGTALVGIGENADGLPEAWLIRGIQPVPEPGSALLLGAGLAALSRRRRPAPVPSI